MLSAAALMVAAAFPMVPVAMVAAVFSVMLMTVMIAGGRSVLNQSSGQQGIHRFVRIAADPGIQLNACLLQSLSGAAADPAADQGIHALTLQKASQRAVAAAAGIRHPGGDHLALRDLVELELSAVPKMLEHLTVFVCNRDFHSFASIQTLGGWPRPAALEIPSL